MPFTFSHPALVLPFIFLPRKYFSLTGLVIGSLTPDFEYFIRMKVESNYSHTISGLFWFDLPLGILLAFLFHNIVRNRLFDNLPIILKSRLSIFKDFNWTKYFKENWIIIILSIIIGAASHLFWDSFTHHNGYFVGVISDLQNSITLLGKQVFIYKILQHTCSLIGTIIITYSLFKMKKNKVSNDRFEMSYWLTLTAITIVIVIIKFVSVEKMQIGNSIVSFISSILIALVISPIIIRKKSNTS